MSRKVGGFTSFTVLVPEQQQLSHARLDFKSLVHKQTYICTSAASEQVTVEKHSTINAVSR